MRLNPDHSDVVVRFFDRHNLITGKKDADIDLNKPVLNGPLRQVNIV